jgi:hypothetical protein
MNKSILLFLFAVAVMANAGATGSPQNYFGMPKPGATLQRMWVDYGVTENNQYGMRIHVAFTAYNLMNMDAFLGIYFEYTGEKSQRLRDINGAYKTALGEVAVSKKFTPSYAVSIFDDMQIFMPYDELDLDPGNYELTMNTQVVYPQGGTIAWLTLYDFLYTQYDQSRGANNTKANATSSAKMKPAKTSGPRAVFDTLWVEHNITDKNGAKGMTIHLKFVAYDMKDVDADVAIYFDYNDAKGGPLKDKNQQYASKNGNVSVFKGIYPAYATAYYDDLQVFMPYNEFDLDPGEYNLSFEAMLIYPDGNLISKFGWYDFTYSRPK